jgi:hypothetical protein
MSRRVIRHIISSNSIPLYAIIAASFISLSLLVIHFIGMDLWKVALLILLAWLPIFVVKTREIYQQYRWLAFFFVLLIAQSVHFTEHIAQMIQIHLLGLSGMQAHGIIGMLDLEWVHFIFDAVWVPLCVYILLFVYRKNNPWLWVLAVIVTWHALEHVAIMSVYLRTGIVGSSGLLAHGGIIAGGLPLVRPDLHFLYNLIEVTLILIAYTYQLKHLSDSEAFNINLNSSIAREKG